MELMNKRKALVSSALIILPALAGLMAWERLPGISGAAKAAFCLGAPAAMLGVHWLCLLLIFRSNRENGQNKKALELVYWLLPCVSAIFGAGTYAVVLEAEPGWERLMPAGLGAMFLIIGNYMPKMKQNPNLGIRLPWTLASEENWNRTHRFGGKVWVTGGVALLVCCFLPASAMVAGTVIAILLLALAPCVYSYHLYRLQVKEGSWVVHSYRSRGSRAMTALGLVIFAVVAVTVPALSFTGDIRFVLEDNALQIEASFWPDTEVAYASVESIEYAEDIPAGERTNGFGSPRLSLGAFRNEEFGGYTRYAYTGCDACVVLRTNGKTLVLGDIDEESTKALYDALYGRIFG